MSSATLNPDIDARVGRWLRSLRQRNAMKQVELAELLGVTYQQANKYEKGQNALPLRHLPALVERLGADPGELLEAIAGTALHPVISPRPSYRLLTAIAALPAARQVALAEFLASERADG